MPSLLFIKNWSLLLMDSIVNKLDFCDVLILPRATRISSRKEVNLNVCVTFPKSLKNLFCTPIAAANMDGVGTPAMANALGSEKMLTFLTKNNTLKIMENGFPEECHDCSSFCVGTFGMDEASIVALKNYKIDNYFNLICLDVANGYMADFVDLVAFVRDKYPSITIFAGNVVTPEGVVNLSEAGADVVKIGIGSGSVCTTRRVAGVGYPQLSAILDCKEAALDSGCMLMSDGGCVYPGDVGKAFAAGANFVMLGGMLAGYEEGLEGGTLFDDGEKKKFIFSGSSSSKALNKSNRNENYRTSEGRVVLMDLKGPVKNAITHILGGLRSTCSYTNCGSLDELIGYGSFIKVNRQLNEYFEYHTVDT